MNIAELLSEQAIAHPNAPAIIDFPRGQRRCLTFAELELASARAATLLLKSKLGPGDTVLVLQPMSAELYIALAAIFRLGLVAMFLDPGQGTKHIEQCCALQRPQALIASARAQLLRLISPALRQTRHKFVIGLPIPGATPWHNIDKLIPSPEIYACSPESPALITFTSGSTGLPKAALRTHRFLLFQHRALAESLKLTAGQVDLATMPIVLLSNLASGVTSLIPPVDLRRPGKIDPAPVVAQIQAEHVTRTVASPALLEKLATHCISNQITLPTLRWVFSGGAPVFPCLLEQLQQIAPQAEIFAVYGSTEAEPMAKIARHAIQTADVDAMRNGQGLLVGSPVDTLQLRIIPDQWGTALGPYQQVEFEALCCEAGTVGEIVVSGGHVLSGYLYGIGNEETKFSVDGVTWHRTGDAGYRDAQGRLWLLGRCAARINDRHGILYPFAVECAVSFQPEIRRSAVIEHAKRRILMIETSDKNLSLAQIQQTLVWAQINEIHIVSHLPVDKRHNAKIDYPALRRLVAIDKLPGDSTRKVNFKD
jgi:acyl-CoA synthetase (AMP-forming)/AMP-acid ligase II